MENKDLIKNVGTNITMCFLEGCPRADKCVRHLAYDMLGEEKTCGNTVMPSSLKANGECGMYFEAQIKRYAKGATHIPTPQRARTATAASLRSTISSRRMEQIVSSRDSASGIRA